jgi:exopolyphosphatase/guanosine-5'-triphosphate,3'-diphosphate pyrophosphatase
VKGIFKEHPVRAFAKKEIVLIGGTATALAMVYLNLSEFDYEKIEGLELHLNDLEMVTTRISNLSKDLRAMLPGLENGRSDVIICGLYWLKSLLERLHVTSFKISTAGIRFGVLYSSLENTHATQ